jgi:hypothetical protein
MLPLPVKDRCESVVEPFEAAWRTEILGTKVRATSMLLLTRVLTSRE